MSSQDQDVMREILMLEYTLDEAKLQKVIDKTMEKNIKAQQKTVDKAKRCVALAESLKKALLKSKVKQYKIVVDVSALEQFGQGCEFSAKCVWSGTTDRVLSWRSPAKDSIVYVASVYFIKYSN